MGPAIPGHLAIGTVVDGKYTIESQLGEGGMGIVYFARDINLETPVVVKGIRPELARNKEFRARILAEGKAMAKIDHENVVRLNSVVVQPDELFLVMQYVDGESLDKTIARYASQQAFMPLDQAFRIFEQILAGVGAAHAKGMIHRDIKPANVLIRTEDSQVKVTDFGIAKAEDEALAGKGLTRTDGLIGSVLYMSPEQIQGERNLDRRVDIYSLGIMLFEMLAGRVPFDGPTAYTTMNMHVREPIPSITFIRPDVPDYVRSVIERACAKSRDLRFGSAADMAVALRPGSVVVSAGPDPLPVVPVFPGGVGVVEGPFVADGGGVVPRRAVSPTHIAMVGDLAAARAVRAPIEEFAVKGATEIASMDECAQSAPSCEEIPVELETGDEGKRAMGSGVLGIFKANPVLLIPVIAAVVMLPLGIYVFGQPSCKSDQTKCGDVCCDNSSEYCDVDGCYRRSCFLGVDPYAIGASDPSNACLVCSDSSFNFEFRGVGAECGPSKYCNAKRQCVVGCVIDGKVYDYGDLSPANLCQGCNPTNSKAWSFANKGIGCENGGVCDGKGNCVSGKDAIQEPPPPTKRPPIEPLRPKPTSTIKGPGAGI